MLKILKARLQQYVNQTLPDVQAGFRKGRRTRDQIVDIHWIIKTQENSRKTSTSASLTMLKAFDCVNHNEPWKILQEMGIPNHHTCLLRNLYACQEAMVRTCHGTKDWFKIEKEVRQGCILSPCLLNIYASTSCEMLGWMKHKLESRLQGEISITSDIQMTPPLWQKVKN